MLCRCKMYSIFGAQSDPTLFSMGLPLSSKGVLSCRGSELNAVVAKKKEKKSLHISDSLQLLTCCASTM